MKRLIASTLLVCLGSFASEFLPLSGGNNRTYRNAQTGDSFTIRVGAPVMQSGRVYYPVTGYTAQPVLVRHDTVANVLFYFDQTFNREVLLTSLVPNAAGWWHAPLRSCAPNGQVQSQRTIHDGPGGHWEVCSTSGIALSAVPMEGSRASSTSRTSEWCSA
jgi:hypothetical protein